MIRERTGNRSLVLFDSGDEVTVQAGDAGHPVPAGLGQADRRAGRVVRADRDEHAGGTAAGRHRAAQRNVHQAKLSARGPRPGMTGGTLVPHAVANGSEVAEQIFDGVWNRGRGSALRMVGRARLTLRARSSQNFSPAEAGLFLGSSERGPGRNREETDGGCFILIPLRRAGSEISSENSEQFQIARGVAAAGRIQAVCPGSSGDGVCNLLSSVILAVSAAPF